MKTPSERALVVGTDLTSSAESALAWAADEAAHRRLPLHLVHAVDEPRHLLRSTAPDTHRSPWHAAVRAACAREIEAARRYALRRHPELTVTTECVDGTPVDVLLSRARACSTLVIGSRHLGTAHGLFTHGAVAIPLAAHAPCPVAVVREPEPRSPAPSPVVVVGVDGSRTSIPAVAFAFEEAAFRDADLLVVAVRPSFPGGGRGEETEQDWRRVLAEATAGRREEYPQVHVRHELLRGHPVEVLTDTAAGTRALVVGTRGLGGFPGLLLGSVSQGVMHHARCPVIVVPHTFAPA